MSLKSKFIQSLMALAVAAPAVHAVAASTADAAPAASAARSGGAIEFASSLPSKLDGSRPDASVIFGQVWPRVDFVEIQQAAGTSANSLDPREALELVNRQV
jgi:hypothetical protein